MLLLKNMAKAKVYHRTGLTDFKKNHPNESEKVAKF